MNQFSFLNKLSLTMDIKDYVEWPYMENPKYKPYWFEVYDAEASRRWFWNNWTLSIYASIVYLILIFCGQIWMKNRQPYNLRKVLSIWNFSLAIFSLCGFLRTGPDLFDVLMGKDGLYRSVCVRDSLNPPTAFWAFAFSVSKLLELGDTAFIVLRKTPLIVLHCKYHHVTVLIFSWLCYPQAEPIFRYVGSINFFVHAIMYGYYGFKALQFKVPRQVSMMITILQLSQMVIGLTVNFYAMWLKMNDVECARSYDGFKIQMGIYGSYLILFSNFFYKTYIQKKKRE